MEPSKQPPSSDKDGAPSKEGGDNGNKNGSGGQQPQTKMPPLMKEYSCSCYYCRLQQGAPSKGKDEDENDENPNRSRTSSGSSSSSDDPSSAATPASLPGATSRPGIGGRRTPVGLPPNLMPSADRTSRQLLQATARRRRRQRLNRERMLTPPPAPPVASASSVASCEVLPRVAEDEENENEDNNGSGQTDGDGAQETSEENVGEEADDLRSQRDQEEGVDHHVDFAAPPSTEGSDLSGDDGENTIGESTLDGDDEVPLATQVLVYATEEPSAPEAYAYLEFFHHHADESHNLYPDDEIAAAAAEAAAAVAVVVMEEAAEERAAVAEATATSLASEECDQEEDATNHRCVTPAISVRSSMTSAHIQEVVAVDAVSFADDGEPSLADFSANGAVITEQIPMEATVVAATSMGEDDDHSEAASALLPYAVATMSSNRYLSDLPEVDERSEHSKKLGSSSVVDDASSVGASSTRTDVFKRFHRRQKRSCRRYRSGRGGRNWLRSMLFSCRSGSPAVDLDAYSPRVPSSHT